MSDLYPKTLVIDNCSDQLKIGFAIEESPNLIFPSIVGKPKYKSNSNIQRYFGNDIEIQAGILIQKYPIHNGIIVDFEEFQDLYSHIFNKELNIDLQNFPVLFTEGSFNNKENRHKLVNVMFEYFNIPSFYLENKSILPIYTSESKTGIVIDCGLESTYFVPVYEGFPIKNAITMLSTGGRHVTAEFIKEMKNNGTTCFNHCVSFNPTHFVNKLKKELCFVSYDFKRDYEESLTTSFPITKFPLPDDSDEFAVVDNARFIAPEILFSNNSEGGIINKLKQSIYKCDKDIRPSLLSNIVLSGGTTSLPGFSERIYKEIHDFVPSADIKIVDGLGREFATWSGGSIFASSKIFQEIAITHKDYDEEGPAIIDYRCI